MAYEKAEYCMRCEELLMSHEDHVTGICADCWTEEDNDSVLDSAMDAWRNF
jgi:hypothetical protein